MGARELLLGLRRTGFKLEPAGDGIAVSPASRLPPSMLEKIRAQKADLLQLLRHERAERAFQEAIRAAEPGHGWAFEGEHLSDTDPATADQVNRLRQLACDPAWGSKRADVEAWAERVVERGVTEAGCYLLIGLLGERLAKRTGQKGAA